MEEDQLLDSELKEALLDNQLKVERKKFLKWIAGLIVINTLGFSVVLAEYKGPASGFL